MTEYLLTFASLTRAQTGLKLLRGRRIAIENYNKSFPYGRNQR